MNGTKWVAPGKGDKWDVLAEAVMCSPDNLPCCQRVEDLIENAGMICTEHMGRKSNLKLTGKPLTETDLKRIVAAGDEGDE